MTAESSDTNDADGSVPSPSSGAPTADQSAGADADRRDFLHTASMWSMAGGLVAGYGTFVTLGGRFVYPNGGRTVAWQYVSRLAEMVKGDAINFTAPDGASIVVARLGDGETTRDFIALSSVCPHLGCQVHWELANDRFFCPCHNGAFDAQGKPTAGPPAQDGRALAKYPLEIRDGLLFIEVPTEGLNRAQTAALSAPSDGHRVADCRGNDGRIVDNVATDNSATDNRSANSQSREV